MSDSIQVPTSAQNARYTFCIWWPRLRCGTRWVLRIVQFFLHNSKEKTTELQNDPGLQGVGGKCVLVRTLVLEHIFAPQKKTPRFRRTLQRAPKLVRTRNTLSFPVRIERNSGERFDVHLTNNPPSRDQLSFRAKFYERPIWALSTLKRSAGNAWMSLAH